LKKEQKKKKKKEQTHKKEKKKEQKIKDRAISKMPHTITNTRQMREGLSIPGSHNPPHAAKIP
jgi:hypothetical protein